MRLGFFIALTLFACLPAAGQKPSLPKPSAPNSVCADCHQDEGPKLAKSTHSTVSCASCHLKHEEYPHPEKQPKPQCKTCHEQPATDYEQSEHAQQMRRGNGMAPECATCHGTAHDVASTRSQDFHKAVPDTCAMCHDKEAGQFQQSVHGKAVAANIKDAPVCTDCHGGHRVLKAKDPKSTVFSASVPDTCGHCHGDLRLMKRFGLPSDRITSFNSSFHGLALRSGNQSVADCASCHGFHDILPSNDPKSKTNTKNLAATCGACHPGAGSRFTIGPIHEVQGNGAAIPLQYAQLFYILVIPGTIGFMLLHHAGDFLMKLRFMRFRGHNISLQMLRAPAPHHERMYLAERIQHIALAVSFIALSYSGFALHYSDSWWAAPFLHWESSFPVRGTVHRIAAAILVATSVGHIVSLIISRRLRHHWTEFLPAVSDIREMVEGTLWRLGLRKERPHQSPHSYIEKIEYWALVWGTLVMAVTGTLLWFNNWTMTFMPKLWIDLARVVHFYEAVLATLAIFIWHFYTVIFDPEVYPMDQSWITGYSPRPERDSHHGD